MAKLNRPILPIVTHEGATAKHINPELQLRRSVMSCLLWENEFYEDGQSISNRISNLIPKVDAQKVSAIAIEAREKMKLRHIPLFIVREMAKLNSHKLLVELTLSRIIQRPDELTEFLAIYWKDGKQPLSAQVKRGLASAFGKFNEYQLAKYNRDNAIKLKDVLFLCHAKPKNLEQELLWKRLINNELVTPDTWEVSLSTGKDKKETFERLIKENRIGALALLRNLRNMQQSKVSDDIILEAISNIKTERVLPFRFITAARYAPNYESQLEISMLKCLNGMEKLGGKTVILVDVSGSMDSSISDKSNVLRMDAGCGLTILVRELTDCKIYSFSDNIVACPNRHGFALRDAITNSQPHSGTYLGKAISVINTMEYDRLIVITDEQSHDTIPNPNGKAYMINVASNEHGVGYGKWIHVDGWSESVLDFIRSVEQEHLS